MGKWIHVSFIYVASYYKSHICFGLFIQHSLPLDFWSEWVTAVEGCLFHHWQTCNASPVNRIKQNSTSRKKLPGMLLVSVISQCIIGLWVNFQKCAVPHQSLKTDSIWHGTLCLRWREKSLKHSFIIICHHQEVWHHMSNIQYTTYGNRNLFLQKHRKHGPCSM